MGLQVALLRPQRLFQAVYRLRSRHTTLPVLASQPYGIRAKTTFFSSA